MEITLVAWRTLLMAGRRDTGSMPSQHRMEPLQPGRRHQPRRHQHVEQIELATFHLRAILIEQPPERQGARPGGPRL